MRGPVLLQKTALISTLLLPIVLAAGTEITLHRLSVTLDPAAHLLTAVDHFQASVTGDLEFQLGADLLVTRLLVDDRLEKFHQVPASDTSHGARRTVAYAIPLNLKSQRLVEVTVEYSGKIFEETGDAAFNREKIAMSVVATISTDGIFLSPDGVFYPTGSEELAYFETEVHLPAGWDAVTEGRRVQVDKSPQGSVLLYSTAHPVDGIHITAARWVVNSRTVEGVEFYTFFFPEDTSLAPQYLDMSIRYTQMYSDLISPYPFSKFAVVENFFPTGYGMPSYTVLGRTVVRLPFIVYTSLGHEVLHNWWGNSVFVGDGGNWCEGLTTYQADYRYKLQAGEEGARQYRKDILKDYSVYTSRTADFPPSGFTRRSDMSTRAIGYGKVAMIFHMLEEWLGTDNFMEALRAVVANHQWTKTGYADLFTALEKASGEDLQPFMTSWIMEPDAPELQLIPGDSDFEIRQLGAVKPLRIPVRLTWGSGETTVKMVPSSSARVLFTPDTMEALEHVSIDPDYHLMRRLSEAEMDATLRNILNEKDFTFVVPEKSEPWTTLAESFQAAISDAGSATLQLSTEILRPGPSIYLGTLPSSGGPDTGPGGFKLDGDVFDPQTNALVWAFKQEEGWPGLVIYSTNTGELDPLPAKLPHYGRYGYLVFSGGRNIRKGNHEPQQSPLSWQRTP